MRASRLALAMTQHCLDSAQAPLTGVTVHAENIAHQLQPPVLPWRTRITRMLHGRLEACRGRRGHGKGGSAT